MSPAKRIEEAIRAYFGGRFGSELKDEIDAAIAAVAAEERERCARVADARQSYWRAEGDRMAREFHRPSSVLEREEESRTIAAAIRAQARAGQNTARTVTPDVTPESRSVRSGRQA